MSPSNELLELWHRRAHQLATNVAEGGRDHRELAHAASLISEDYRDRFLIELIQNANDQALLSSTGPSTVVVIRTENMLAVSNGGQVVSQRNLERLSSLADSDKTGVLVGNKGVGFKAVYHVTDAPEVYSAIESPAGTPQKSLFGHFRIGIALEQKPFDDPGLRDVVEAEVLAFLSRNDGLAASLASRTENTLELVRAEYPYVAGFKFPLARSLGDLQSRLAGCDLPDDLWPHIQTLVVLPLRDPTASSDAESALDRLIGTDDQTASEAELGLLFLSGIGRIVIIDQVRGRTTEIARTKTSEIAGLKRVTITATSHHGRIRRQRYWINRRDALDCDEAIATVRRQTVSDALAKFRLEAWDPSDPLPVTVAIPISAKIGVNALNASGVFCLGLPTQQRTGLPVHVDARFFATISRTGLDFAQTYNDMLLEVANSLLAELLSGLRHSRALRTRRTATLALERTDGALADRAFAVGGLADGDVVLSADGVTFVSRLACPFPNAAERALLPLIMPTLGEDEELLRSLPEIGLLLDAPSALESLGLPAVPDNPHPWVCRSAGAPSILERSARANRDLTTEFWAPFVAAVLDCFQQSVLLPQIWLPVGVSELAAPKDRVFLPAHTDTTADDDEVSVVPPEVASRLRLLDDRALRIRQEGRSLTVTASRLSEQRLVQSPRKADLLEAALFPALKDAAASEFQAHLAMALFVQALVWIKSMKPASLLKLDCRGAMAPHLLETGDVAWALATDLYLGSGWGLATSHDRLLELAYPGRRVVPFGLMRDRFGLPEGDPTAWKSSAERMGLNAWPITRVFTNPRAAPLMSSGYRLIVKPCTALGDPALELVYQAYIGRLSKRTSHWDWSFDHDVTDLRWIDGLEHEDRRIHVVDLMLANHTTYLANSTVSFGRVAHSLGQEHVPQMWHFALTDLNWAVFPAERGAGNAPERVTSKRLWRLPEGVRRSTGYAQQLIVAPVAVAPATPLLRSLGVPSIGEAPLSRLFGALSNLAERLDIELLHTRNDALSLAKELYAALNERLATEPAGPIPADIQLPLFQDRRLFCVDPRLTTTRIVFDDDLARARHIDGVDEAYRVPISRETSIDRIHRLFVQTWGADRVLRTSTAPIALDFRPTAAGVSIPFLTWVRAEYPQGDVAAELAALLTFGGERTLTSERLTRHWKDFSNLKLIFGSFQTVGVASFYNRSADELWLGNALAFHEVVAATWEIAGQRTRDLLAGFGRALTEQSSRAFLQDRGITDVEIVDVTDEAGLHRPTDVKALSPALLAAKIHATPGLSLDEAATWLAGLGTRPEDLASALGQDDLSQVLRSAIGLRPPEGELMVLRHLGIPVSLWQEAIIRRDGKAYEFSDTVRRYDEVLRHLVAVAKELAVRSLSVDLLSIAKLSAQLLSTQVPKSVATLPLESAHAERAAIDFVVSSLADFGLVARHLASIASPPWSDELPIPEDTARRGVRLFLEVSRSAREIDASTSVHAVIEVASRLASALGESVDAAVVLADPALQIRIGGDWAHVYSALSRVRTLLERTAPEVVRTLTSVQAFRDPSTLQSLLAKLPTVARKAADIVESKHEVLGHSLTESEIRNALLDGTSGVLGTTLTTAAAQPLDPDVVSGARRPLPPPGTPKPGKGRTGSGGKGSGTSSPESRIIGDIGEAFFHEWLNKRLGTDYGADCWVSNSRERYGLPAAGTDDVGYDFRVPDPLGKLFDKPAATFLVEVKATSTDGGGAFPMTTNEWEQARRCHEAKGDEVYVIVRVFNALEAPHVGDVLIDPFAALLEGKVRLANRDLWVTVAPLFAEPT